jgi:multidrug efflux pump subunit AcrA (membrane-fusion protein)
MSAHLSTTGGRRTDPESHAWQELEDVFAGLSRLARSPVASHEFYRALVESSVRALSAIGGVVWLRAESGALQPIVQIHWPHTELFSDESSRRAHEAVLADAASRAHVATIAPGSAGAEKDGSNPTEHTLLIGPVNAHSANDVPATVAIVELVVRSGASPATYRGYEQFLSGVCELAADYHAFAELRRRREEDDYREQLVELSSLVHRETSLAETAYAVANEGRRVIGCDRLSVIAKRGRRCRLLATSGVSHVERRSGAARRIEQLADLVQRMDEAAFYTDGQCDGLPPVAEALEQHAEESHTRQVAAIPLRRSSQHVSGDSDRDATRQKAPRHQSPLFVLVAEQFDAREELLQRDRLVEVGDVCTTALYNAYEVERMPLRWFLRPLGAVQEQIISHLPRTAFVVAAIGAAIAALVLVPTDFKIEAVGTVQPVVRRDVFAPRSGLVEEVFVAHGAEVAAGQPLVRLHDPLLELELKRVDGELETAQRQIDAVRATRTNRQVRDASPADAYRLSAEERELQQRLTNLRRELELLNREREQLVVTSPIAGRVLTWDLSNRLIARPVERGEVLVTVADVAREWQLELEVPDDRVGHVLAAQEKFGPDLAVRFRLSSDDREQHTGKISEMSRTAAVRDEDGGIASPVVILKVALDEDELRNGASSELQPGVSARAQIACGRRPLGYVWLHDIWDAAIEWLWF